MVSEDEFDLSWLELEEDESNNVVGGDRPEIKRFEDYCSSYTLSIDELRRMSKDISLDDLHNSSFLHRVCINKNVTLEIIEYLLDLYPPAIHSCLDISFEYNYYPVELAYPLHLACYNKECPNEVIELLLQQYYPSCNYQLTSMCYMHCNWGMTDIIADGPHGGTPLHYYLSRTSNTDLRIVKQLAVNTEVIQSFDQNIKCTPINILMNNESIGNMYEVMKYLVEANPSSLLLKDEYNQNPLHVACDNIHISARAVQILLEACPQLACQEGYHPRAQSLPIHNLCRCVLNYEGRKMDDIVATDILKLLLEYYPDSVHCDEYGYGELPLHYAAGHKSPGFCKLLVDAYPDSVRRRSDNGSLPIHNACLRNCRVDTLEYLLEVYPESLHIRNGNGYLPIHLACHRPGENTSGIIQFMLIRDPECLSKPVVSDDFDNDYSEVNGSLPLHVVCDSEEKPRDDVARLLFDLYPEAILIRNEKGQLPIDVLRSRDGELPTTINSVTGRPNNEELRRRNKELITFLYTQEYMAILEPTPLHCAIRVGAPLGTIKLLVKGKPSEVNVHDASGYPLVIACQFSTVGVVKYLAGLVPVDLNTCDVNKNFPLHHACIEGNCDVISYLLDRPMSSASVSERNVDDMLPIHLFCEFVKGRWCEGETPEYTETIWRLLTAYPETVLNW